MRYTADVSAPYYVELRVYTTKDALNTAPDQRYKKTLTTLKVQLNTEDTEWGYLQKLLRSVKTEKFIGNSTFYSDKITFK